MISGSDEGRKLALAAELATMAEVSMLGATATRGPPLARLRLPVGAGLRPGVAEAAARGAARVGAEAAALAAA